MKHILNILILLSLNTSLIAANDGQISALSKAIKTVERKYVLYVKCLKQNCSQQELKEAQKDFATAVKVAIGAVVVAGGLVGAKYWYSKKYAQNPDEKVFKAIENSDTAALDALVKKGAHLDTTMLSGRSRLDPLQFAIACDNPKIVQHILNNYSSNFSLDKYDETSPDHPIALALQKKTIGQTTKKIIINHYQKELPKFIEQIQKNLEPEYANLITKKIEDLDYLKNQPNAPTSINPEPKPVPIFTTNEKVTYYGTEYIVTEPSRTGNSGIAYVGISSPDGGSFQLVEPSDPMLKKISKPTHTVKEVIELIKGGKLDDVKSLIQSDIWKIDPNVSPAAYSMQAAAFSTPEMVQLFIDTTGIDPRTRFGFGGWGVTDMLEAAVIKGKNAAVATYLLQKYDFSNNDYDNYKQNAFEIIQKHSEPEWAEAKRILKEKYSR